MICCNSSFSSVLFGCLLGGLASEAGDGRRGLALAALSFHPLSSLASLNMLCVLFVFVLYYSRIFGYNKAVGGGGLILMFVFGGFYV